MNVSIWYFIFFFFQTVWSCFEPHIGNLSQTWSKCNILFQWVCVGECVGEGKGVTFCCLCVGAYPVLYDCIPSILTQNILPFTQLEIPLNCGRTPKTASYPINNNNNQNITIQWCTKVFRQKSNHIHSRVLWSKCN